MCAAAAAAAAAAAEVTIVAFAATGVTVSVADAALVDPCVATTYAETVDGSDAGAGAVVRPACPWAVTDTTLIHGRRATTGPRAVDRCGPTADTRAVCRG